MAAKSILILPRGVPQHGIEISAGIDLPLMLEKLG
jgi:hypothetical protein